MTYRNRELIREPLAMIRGNREEEDMLDVLVEEYGGVSRSEAYRLALLDMAMQKRHERNSLAPRRINQTVDKYVFGGLLAA